MERNSRANGLKTVSRNAADTCGTRDGTQDSLLEFSEPLDFPRAKVILLRGSFG